MRADRRGSPGPEPDRLSASQAAAYLSISTSTLHNWANSGLIHRHSTGGRYSWYRREELDRIIQAAAEADIPLIYHLARQHNLEHGVPDGRSRPATEART